VTALVIVIVRISRRILSEESAICRLHDDLVRIAAVRGCIDRGTDDLVVVSRSFDPDSPPSVLSP